MCDERDGEDERDGNECVTRKKGMGRMREMARLSCISMKCIQVHMFHWGITDPFSLP